MCCFQCHCITEFFYSIQKMIHYSVMYGNQFGKDKRYKTEFFQIEDLITEGFICSTEAPCGKFVIWYWAIWIKVTGRDMIKSLHWYRPSEKHPLTHLEWFSPSVTAILQIPWQASISPFWTASLSCSWRASTWGTSFSKVFTYLQPMDTEKEMPELKVRNPVQLKCSASEMRMTCRARLTHTAHS